MSNFKAQADQAAAKAKELRMTLNRSLAAEREERRRIKRYHDDLRAKIRDLENSVTTLRRKAKDAGETSSGGGWW